jgi:hypothetical protein
VILLAGPWLLSISYQGSDVEKLCFKVLTEDEIFLQATSHISSFAIHTNLKTCILTYDY